MGIKKVKKKKKSFRNENLSRKDASFRTLATPQQKGRNKCNFRFGPENLSHLSCSLNTPKKQRTLIQNKIVTSGYFQGLYCIGCMHLFWAFENL